MEKLKFGIIGTGWIAKQFASDLQHVHAAELVAVTARNIEKTKEFATEFGVSAFAMDEFWNEIDVAYIATPHSAHAELCLLALEHGKHVLCEKPFALNSSEAERVFSFAAGKGLFVMEAMWTRFLPAISELKKMVSEKRFGNLREMHLSMGCKMNEKFFPRMFDPKMGGGSLLDMGVYCASFAHFLIEGTPEVSSELELHSSGVDNAATWTLSFPGGERVESKSSMVENLPGEGLLRFDSGTEIKIIDFWRAQSLFIDGEEVDFSFSGMGLQFQVEHLCEKVRTGASESDVMSWGGTVEVLKTLEKIR